MADESFSQLQEFLRAPPPVPPPPPTVEPPAAKTPDPRTEPLDYLARKQEEAEERAATEAAETLTPEQAAAYQPLREAPSVAPEGFLVQEKPAGFLASVGFQTEADLAEQMASQRGQRAADALIADIRRDERAVTAYNLYAEAAEGHESYINNRVEQKAADMGADLGKMDEAAQRKLRTEAIEEVAALKTAGMWPTPAWLPKGMDPEAITLGEAWKPRIEIVGLYEGPDGKRHVVVRVESAGSTFLRDLDTLSEAGAGIVAKGIEKTRKGEPFTLPEIAQAAKGGISKAESLGGVAFKQPEIQKQLAGIVRPAVETSALGRAAGFSVVAGAIALDLAFPDAASIPGMAAAVGRTLPAARRLALTVTPEALSSTKRAANLAAEIADASAAGDGARMDAASAALRDASPQAARKLDQLDADAARVLVIVEPKIASASFARIVSPGKGAPQITLHPSFRRRQAVVRGPRGEVAGTEAYPVTFGAEAALDYVKKGRAADAAVDDAERLRRAQAAADAAIAKFKPVLDGVNKRAASVVARKLRASVADGLIDPKAWAKKAQDIVRKHKAFEGTDDAAKAVRAEYHSAVGTLAGEVYRLHLGADLTRWDEAERIVRLNIEQRGLAAAQLSDELMGRVPANGLWGELSKDAGKLTTYRTSMRVLGVGREKGVDVNVLDYIQAELKAAGVELSADDLKAAMTPGGGLDLRKAAERAGLRAGELPELTEEGEKLKRAFADAFGFDDARAEVAARITDARARNWASRAPGRTPEQWYGLHQLEVRRGMPEEGEAEGAVTLAQASEAGEPDIFFSGLRRVIEEKMPPTLPTAGVIGWVSKQAGVKPEELEWTEIAAFVDAEAAAGHKHVAKDALLKWADEHAVRVEEVWKGGPELAKTAQAKTRIAEIFETARERIEKLKIEKADDIAAADAERLRLFLAQDPIKNERRRLWTEVIVPALERNGMLGFDDATQAYDAIRQHPDWRQRWETDITEVEEASIHRRAGAYAALGLMDAARNQFVNSSILGDIAAADYALSDASLHGMQAGSFGVYGGLPAEIERVFGADADELKTLVRVVGDTAGERSRARWPGYVLGRAGDNYRELLLTLPERARTGLTPEQNARHYELSRKMDTWAEGAGPELTPPERGELAILDELYKLSKADVDYGSPHWSEPNVLVHVRLTDRVTADGKKTLHVEEIQSDWHQAGRKWGYAGDIGGVRKALSVAMTEVHAGTGRAYGTIRNGSRIVANVINDTDTGVWKVSHEVGTTRHAFEGKNQDEVLDWVAKSEATRSYSLTPDAPFKKSWPDLALKRALRVAADEGYDAITWNSGDAIRGIVGGQEAGQNFFYDTLIGQQMKKLTGKYGGAPGDTKIVLGEREPEFSAAETGMLDTAARAEPELADAHILPITPEMREAFSRAQPLFQRAEPATVPAAAPGSAPSPTIEPGGNDPYLQDAFVKALQFDVNGRPSVMVIDLARLIERTSIDPQRKALAGALVRKLPADGTVAAWPRQAMAHERDADYAAGYTWAFDASRPAASGHTFPPRSIALDVWDGLREETVLHEMVHLATIYQLQAGSKAAASVKRDLQRLLGYVKADYMQKLGISDWGKEAPRHLRVRLDNELELVAYALTNKGFQDELANIKYTPMATVWSEFIALLARLIGIEPSEHSALAEIVRQTGELLTFGPHPYSLDAPPSRLLQRAGKTGDAKAAATFAGDGRTIISALEKPDISSAVHELGHVFRRDLEPAEADHVVTWLRDTVKTAPKPGAAPDATPLSFADLRYEEGRFVHIDAAVTEAAEEAFARGFERYLREGTSPSTVLARVFEQLKSWLRKIYKTIKGSGVDVPLSPDMRRVFDGLLAEPEVSLVYSADDLARLQRKVEDGILQKLGEVRAGATTSTSSGAGLPATDTTERMFQMASGSGAGAQAARMALFVMFGGDADAAIRAFPQETQARIKVLGRIVRSGIHDTSRMLLERDFDRVASYIGGTEGMTFQDGKAVPSAGFDSAGAVLGQMRRKFDRLTGTEQLRLRQLSATVQAGDDAMRAARANPELLKPMMDFFYDRQGIFTQHLAMALKPQGFPQKGAGHWELPREGRLVEALLYYAGVVPRGGAGASFAGDSVAATKGLLTEIGNIYGSAAPYKTALLLGAHGHAAKARNLAAGFGLGVDAQTAQTFTRFLYAEAVDRRLVDRMKEMARTFGVDPEAIAFMEADPLDALGMYLPAKAVSRITAPIDALFERATGPARLLGESAIGVDALEIAWRIWKGTHTRGNIITRPRYFSLNAADVFTLLGVTSGLRNGAVAASRTAVQNLLAIPGVGNILYAGSRLVGKPAAPEAIRRVLQTGGDAVAHALGAIMRSSKYRIEVNDVLDATTRPMALGGKRYTGAGIREVAQQEGIFGTFDTEVLERVIKGQINLTAKNTEPGVMAAFGNWLQDFASEALRIVPDIAEAISERERLGMMITLMEGGVDARTAARVAVKSAFDYSGSMSKLDRHILMQVFFPFWAYQKNANRAVFNALFTVQGAYRLRAIRRMQTLGPAAISHILYAHGVDAYGVVPDNLDEDSREQYYMLIDGLERYYGGYEKVPEDAKIAVRAIVRGAATAQEGGKLYTLGQYSTEQLDIEKLVAGGQRRAAAIPPHPSTARSGLPAYKRDTPGIVITPRMRDAVNDFYARSAPDQPQLMLLMPESTIQAGLQHLTAIMATTILAADKAGLDLGYISEGSEADPTPLRAPLKGAVDPERSPAFRIYGEIMADKGRLKLDPLIGYYLDRLSGGMIPVIWKQESTDPNAPETDWKPAPDDGAYVFKDKVAYLPPGFASLLLEGTPLFDINDRLLKSRRGPFERAQAEDERRVMLLAWARGITGVETVEVSPAAAARREEVRSPIDTSAPPQ